MREREAELIASLRAIGTEAGALHEEPDSTPDAAFVGAVLGRIRPLPSPRARRRRRLLGRAFAVFTAMCLVVVPGPRQAIARWLGIGSVQISRAPIPTGLPPEVGDLDLGEPATSEDAAELLGHPIWNPAGSVALGIWIQPEHLMVSSVYRIEGHVVLISELAGPGDVYLLKKVAPAGASIDFVQVRGQPAVWISGHPHEVAMIGPSGLDVVPVRLAGNVLVWADQDRTIRIEGLEDRGDATAVLESLGP